MAMLAAAKRDSKLIRLARHPLLKGCSPAELRRLATVFDEVRILRGDTLVDAAPLARWFFLIDAGEVELRDADGVVGTLGAGESFGHAALKLRDRQATTAKARTDVAAFAAGGRELLGLITQIPALAAGPLGAYAPARTKAPPAPRAARPRPVTRPPTRPPIRLRPAPILTPPPPPPVPKNRKRHLAVALGVVVTVMLGAAQYHPPFLLLTPGPVVDITNDVSISGVTTHQPSGQYLLTTVRASRPNLLQMGFLGFRGTVEVVRLSGSAGSHNAIKQRGLKQFEASRIAAAAAAAKAAGFKGELNVRFQPRDIVGPSAGLVYALLISDMLSPGDLSHGRVLAATGTIDSNGAVGLVGGVAEKAAGVRRAGGTLLLLPFDQLVGAGNLGISVIGVGSLADALKALRD